MTMKLILKDHTRGINYHTIWIYEQDGKMAGINHNHDHSVGFYLFTVNPDGTPNDGEGCCTVWYPSLKTAKATLQKYLSGEIISIPDGHDANVCHLCKCHYSFNSSEHRDAPFDQACDGFKKQFRGVVPA